MKILAENDYKFQSEGSKYFIDKFILGTKNPRNVKEIIEARKVEKISNEQDKRIKSFKENKGKL